MSGQEGQDRQFRNKRKFSFDRSICLGDILQVLLLVVGGISAIAVGSYKLERLGGEMDDLQGKVSIMHDDITVLKTGFSDMVRGH